MTDTQFDRWDIDTSGLWDLPQWFDSFMDEQIPRKRFKPYNHNKRKRWKIESYQVIRYDDSMSDW